MFAPGCHPFPSVLDDVLLPSHSISNTPIKIPAWMVVLSSTGQSIAAAVTPWQFPVETGLRSSQASLSGKGATNQKLFVCRTITYNKMGWYCFGTLHETCTAINVIPSAYSENAPTTAM